MTNNAAEFTIPDSVHINFQRGSNKSLKKFTVTNEESKTSPTDSADYFEETFDTFETVVVQKIAPLSENEPKKPLDSDSKSSFNDFEYWNRSISNIDSLLMVDPMQHDESGTDDDDENIYANDETQIIEFEYQESKPEKRSKKTSKSSFNNIESTSSTTSADELVNAYYARKLGTITKAPICDLNTCTQDTQSITSQTKISETTYLKWDYDKNKFVENIEPITKKDETLTIDVKSNNQPQEPLSPTSNLITTQRYLHTSSHSLANSNFTSPVQSPETASANQLLSSSSVVSKIKSWLIRPTKAPPSQNTTPVLPHNDEIKTVTLISLIISL